MAIHNSPKGHKMRGAFLVLVVTFSFLLAGCDNLAKSKITDPNHPDFDKYQFLWSDYGSALELVEVFKIIIPEGASREEVEKILLNDPEARITRSQTFDEYMARRPGPNRGVLYKTMSKEPEFARIESVVSYVGPLSFSDNLLVMGKTDWTTRVFYDEAENVVEILVYIFPVHRKERN